MAHTICIANQKEGAGKTTTAVNIATSLALYEKKTLLIDCDPQADLSRYTGIFVPEHDRNLYHGFMGQSDAEQIVSPTFIQRLFMIPAGPDLFMAEHRLAIKPGKELTLKKLVQDQADHFEYIIIDSPSSLGFFTICAMAAADWTVFPYQPDVSTMGDLLNLNEILTMVREQLNPDVRPPGVLFNAFSGEHPEPAQPPVDVPASLPCRPFSVVIPLDPMIEDAGREKKPAAMRDIMSPGAQAFLLLTAELIEALN